MDKLGIGVLALLLAWPATARAYVRATTESQTPLRWVGTDCIPVRINANGSTDVADGSDVEAAKKALDGWREATRHCSYIQFKLLPDSPEAAPGFTKAGPNECVIAWQESTWPYDSATASITTLYFVDKPGDPQDGAILDGDIELNDWNFTFATDGSPGKTDIWNVVAHEAGTLLGLDRLCHDGSRPTRPKDHEGNPIPDCATVIGSSDPAHLEMQGATMWNFSDPGETKKRTPEADDVQGVCAIYPLADDPGCHWGAPAVDGGTVVDSGTASGDGSDAVPQRSGCSCSVETRVETGTLAPVVLAAICVLLLAALAWQEQRGRRVVLGRKKRRRERRWTS